jgi:aminopeptidase YwaD
MTAAGGFRVASGGRLLALVCVVMVVHSHAAADDAACATRLRGRIETLTAPTLAGRAAGWPGGRAAAETLSSWYAAAGLSPAFAGAWRQEFPLTGAGWAGDALTGRGGANVGGALFGAGALAGRWVLVAAHFDHLGELLPDESAATVPADSAYYPGANDNASGVAIVHELARHLTSAAAAAAGGPDRRSVLLLNLDAEEVGLQGAAWFVTHPPVPLDSLDVMINLDTVGHLFDDRLIVSGLGTAESLAPAVEAAARAAGLTVNPANGGWSGSDHMVFNTREVPVLFLFGGPYPEYNRPSDTAARLDYPAMTRIVAFTVALVDGLRTVPGKFAWRMVADGALRDQADSVGPGRSGAVDTQTVNRQTWLGTMPDFTEGQTGYRLAGVFAGSPAAAAGLQKGDLLVRFGDDPVTDLDTFTTALRAHAPGDLIEVGIVRDGRDLRFTVALGDRAQRR